MPLISNRRLGSCARMRSLILCLLETKIKKNKVDDMTNKIFGGWHVLTNLESHSNGRIMMIWMPDIYRVIPLCIIAQHDNCEVLFSLLD